MSETITPKRPKDPTRSVARRRVLYVAGYDPFPPRRYREIYRREGATQAALSGYELKVLPHDMTEGFGWGVFARMEEGETRSDVEMLTWSDIVQQSMRGSIAHTYWLTARAIWTYGRAGVLPRLTHLRPGPVIAAAYPVAFLLLQLVVASLAAWALWSMLAAWLHPLAGPLALAVIPALLIWLRRQDRHIMAYYLLHNYAFAAQLNGRTPPDLSARIDLFAERLTAALSSDVDEVLVVAHSAGVHIAVEMIARTLRRAEGTDRNGPVLSFLSLGHVVPMAGFLPGASQLRADLNYLSEAERLIWVDVTAPGDGCAFALCDPVAVCGAAGPDKRWPLVVSAAFTQTLKPETWKALRWRFFRLHFQYLHAFDQPGAYDYFRITAGPKTLAARFAGRAPSRSRIETVTSPHVERAA